MVGLRRAVDFTQYPFTLRFNWEVRIDGREHLELGQVREDGHAKETHRY